MHNILHNMAHNMALPTHVTKRNGIYQYVRRVPDDVAGHIGRTRIQTSLKTHDMRIARERAFELDQAWDRRFDEARLAIGNVSRDGDTGTWLSTVKWSREDWTNLAKWVELTLIEEDWIARVGRAPGALLVSDPNPRDIPVDDDETFSRNLKRLRALKEFTAETYIAERRAFIARLVRTLGVHLDPKSGLYGHFMLECHRAELRFFETYLLRNQHRGGIGNPHPNTIQGPWRVAAPSEPTTGQTAPVTAAPTRSLAASGYTFDDCIDKWRALRKAAGKPENERYLEEMRKTVKLFSRRYNIRDIAQVTRRDIVDFRDNLAAGSMAVATVNKKVGYITALINTANHAGWIEHRFADNIYLTVPDTQGKRDPYPDEVIGRIFGNRIFTAGFRHKRAKACAEVQFWLPLIACLHGMSSSEILQLGPDTVGPNPDDPDILCFNITNANSRRIKENARKRYVPIRHELVELGFLDLVEKARRQDDISLVLTYGENLRRGDHQ
ncbi:MAG: hypothetical protein HLUCCO17_16285 [Saliniramus fredricksonii]|uniref:Core-binding (CB) domain-containing protein n=2 Tax=Saliniramus fredricksonii TaxID=1653334 RepID=A0A0N8KDP3_9HYPH|nr:MAG: hypothetical protein HLUCCO17_16285 [Saliniramus fredricksonii]SCC81635.1 hypothetical protein GA0071312_2590 [Saliniramus fredricksonii]